MTPPTTMRAVLMPGDKRVEVVDRPIPALGPREVLVRTKASAICRSDMSIYHGDPVLGQQRSGDGLRVPGHEAAGIVEAVGSAVSEISVGDRVASYLAIGNVEDEYGAKGYLMLTPNWQCFGFDVDGGDADYFLLPETNCLPLPDQLSFAAGAVATDMVGTQFFTQKRLGVGSGSVVAVIGLGPMGSAAVLVAKAHGAVVIAVDVLESRLVHAMELGADHLINSAESDFPELIRSLTGGSGAHFVIECSGNSQAQTSALDCAAKLGAVAYVGESKATTIHPSDQMIHKQLTLIGGWYFPRHEWNNITSFIVDKQIDVEKLISHRFYIEQAPEAFAAFDRRETDKAIFIWPDTAQNAPGKKQLKSDARGR
jgi:L-iditol 2-dehydrogenase